MTPGELAKVTKAMRDLGYAAKEIDACNGDQGALLSLMASVRSDVVRSGNGVAYGSRRPNDKTLKGVDEELANKVLNAAAAKGVA